MLLQSDLAIDLTIYELQGDKSLPADGASDIWGLLNGYPIGGDTAEMVSTFQEQFELSKVQDSGVLSMLSSIDGSFTMIVQDETSKININYCAVGQGIKCSTMLNALLSCPAEKEFLNKKKVIAKELVGFLRDWADSNQKPEASTGTSSESDPYSDRDPKVDVKNAYFDTIDELKMIPGWDDDMHRVFAPYLTVYPKPEETAKQSEVFVNFNSADRSMLACLLPKSRRECAESAASHMDARKKLEVALSSGSGGLKEAIGQYFCESRKEAVQQFSYRSDVYRINVIATVGDQTKEISTVIMRGIPDAIDKRDGIDITAKTLFWSLN
jgi:type II secretory pathway component PulK